MRLISINSLKVNDRLAMPILNQEGIVLLPSNALITEAYISKLKSFGVDLVFIQDELFDDVEAKATLSIETKSYVISAMSGVFESISSGKPLNSIALEKSVKGILEDIGPTADQPVNIFNLFTIKDSRCHHALNVATIVAAMVIRYSLDNEFSPALIKDIVTAALLHDACLDKMDDDLTNKSHPDKIFNKLKAIKTSSTRTYTSCLMHHECYDGSGYPKRLAGEAIYIGARIIAAADLYDSLVNGYGYQSKMKEHEAFEYVNSQMGIVIDPLIIKYFNSTVSIYPSGSTVMLSNGQSAVVISQTSIPTRPKIRLSMPKREDCILLDLTEQNTLFIEKIII